ncbi:MAG: glycosyltransferase [Thermodesulfobacteriota bacterium]
MTKGKTNHPAISVIIPTFNRADLLEHSLKSLTNQTLPQQHYEVIVIDDGSQDHTRQTCDKMQEALPLRYYYQENSGIAAAKNLGIFLSRAPILFFFDDDDVADKELLREHLKTHSEHLGENIAVLGYTTWSPTLKVTPVMHFVTDIGHLLFSYSNLKDGQQLDFTYFWGGRSSCKRSLLVKHGVFKPQFRFGSEDIELGYRLSKFGLRVIFNKNAISYMIRPITYDEFCRRCEKQGRSQYWFSQLHPDPIIQRYCMVEKVEEKWRFAEKQIECKVNRVHEIESLLTSHSKGNVPRPIMGELMNLYTWTFNAFKIKGIVQEMRSHRAASRATLERRFPVRAVPKDDLSYFLEKWRSLPDPPKEKENILVIDPFLPMFDRASGSLRLFHILKSLIRMNYHVTFIARSPARANFYLPILQDLGIEAYAGDRSGLEHVGSNEIAPDVDLEKILTERQYKIVILDFWNLAEDYLPLVRRYSPASKIIVDSVDIHFLREMREAETKRDGELKAKALRNKKREMAVYQQADRVWVVTPDDKKAIEGFIQGKPIDVIPNVHEKIDDKKIYGETKDLLFVGNFNHRPNIDAVHFFCKEVFPSILQELKDVTLFVVGNNPPDEIEALASEHIVVTGYVPDLTPYLRNARISVNPLRYGAGMKGKIGEALSWGLPVVTTSVGAEGMGLVDGHDALIADAPDGFAAQVVRLYRDEALWNQLSLNGKRTVESQWSPEAIQKRLVSVFKKIDSLGEKVSIVVLTFNELEYTKRCVENIRKHTPEPHEIIFVDNGSKDGTVKWLKKLIQENPNFKLIENKTNLGFAKGCNQGIAASSGEYILLLNNDVLVTEGWLSGMIECLNSAPEIGVVGPMTNHISGPQKVPHPDYGPIDRLDRYAEAFREKYRYRRIPATRIVGFCMLFRRKLVEQIGFLDETFGSGNYEDDDFCLRASLEGYKNLIAGDVFVHHYGSRSFIGNGINYDASLAANRKKFSQKWDGLDPQSPLGKKALVLKVLRKADELNQRGQKDEAIMMLIGGMKLFPNEVEFHYRLAEMLIDLKKYKDGLDILNEMPPDSHEIRKLALMGYCQEGLELYDEAEECAERALRLNPAAALAFNLKGVVAYQRGDKETAERFFEKAIEADPSDGEPYTNLGVLKWAAGKKEEALHFLEKGFILSPKMTDIVSAYYSAIIAMEEFPRAERLFQETKGLYPLDKRITFLLIDLLIRQGKDHEAMKHIEDAMIAFGVDEGMVKAALEIRSRIGMKEIDSKAKGKPKLSLCMIVKNEQENLPKCLRSVRPVVDEMMVVDTGSTDLTKEVAQAFGAKVYEFEWQDSFAEARNYSISKASGAWILVLDADETISPKDYDQLRRLVKKGKTNACAYSFMTRNYVNRSNVEEWRENDGSYAAEEAGMGWLPSQKVRLFPNDKRIRFENPVHELVEPSLNRARINIKSGNVVIHHYGKLNEEKSSSKGETYYQLGKRKLEQMRGDAGALRELAVQASSLGRHEEAVELWEKILSLQPDNASAYLNLGHSYLQLERFEEALMASKKAMELDPKMKEAVYNFSICELCAGEVQTAIDALESLLKRVPGYPSAMGLLGVAYIIHGRTKMGLEYVEKLWKKRDEAAEYLSNHAARLLKAGRREDAKSLLDVAIACNDSNETLLTLRQACLNTGVVPNPCDQKEEISCPAEVVAG